MALRLFCHHGHRLEITGELTNGTLVCHRCGSITKFTPADETKRSGAIDVTIDSGSQSDAQRRVVSREAEVASDASLFLTLDHEPGSASAIANATPRKRDEQLEPPSLAGYQILDELGRGGMGVVYRARNESLGRDVALKTLQHMSPDGLHRFKQEFRTLADIAHPNLASLYELLSDGQTWSFTMEILEGVDLLEYVWSGFDKLNSDEHDKPMTQDADSPRLTEERLQRLDESLKQLAIGLNALHEAGVLHSDIKPSNVLMTKEGRLVLLDFGLAAEMRRHNKDKTRTVQGTPLYMAPEQAAGGPLSQASDWYAVGVVLYEVLTGQFPFSGKTVEILTRKQSESPISPERLARDTPEHLNSLCIALLDRNPEKRPAAAEILRHLGAVHLADEVAATQRATSRSTVELVGRERHFEVLRESFSQVSDGNTRTIFVHGQSGMGKSVLVRSFLDEVQQQGEAVVLEGRCYEQESVPFKALDSLIDSLAVFLGTLPESVVTGIMPRDRLALTRVFPVLGRVPEMPKATYPSIENADQQELRQRAMNALRELLQRLAIREPLVLYIDDLQWGDVDSAGLLADLVRPPDAPRMLLLGSYRSEAVDSSQCLQALAEAYNTGQHRPHREELAVEALSRDESKQLALVLLGDDGETSQTYADKIAEESRGWPFFVWELVQHIQADLEIADLTLELDEVIWARVTRLPPDATRLLEQISVAARPMPTAELYQAMDVVSKGPGLLAHLRASNFVRTTESKDGGTLVEAYHDRIRESVINHLDEPRVKGHNLNLALMIERVSDIKVEVLRSHINSTPEFEEPDEAYSLDKRDWQRVFDLAYFFDAAGEHERALPYAVAAAEKARSQNSLEVAEEQYNIALCGSVASDPAVRFRVAEGLGQVLMTRGRYEQANSHFHAARSLAEGNLALARIDGRLGASAFRSGAMGNAGEYLEKALMALGEFPPRNIVTLSLALCKEGIIQLLHTYLPSWFVGRRSADTPDCRLDLLRVGLFDQLSITYWFTRGMLLTLWAHLRQMNLAERYPPSTELSKTYTFHAITMTAIPLAQRGIAYAEKAYRISRDLGDLWGQGKARSYHTFSCIVLARFEEGVETSREAVRLLEQAGDVWEANMARMIGSQPLYHLGELETAFRESRQTYEIGKETGDYAAMAISLKFWMPLPKAGEAIPDGAIQAEVDRPREDPLSSAAALQARGLELLLRDDRPLEAAQVLQQSLDLAKQRGLRNVCIFEGVTWKATALRVVAERAPKGSAQRSAVKDAKKAVGDALKITKSFLACRPHALRERALIAVLEGNEDQARRYFDESLRVAEKHEARHQRAKSLLARAEAGTKFRWPEAEQQLAEARTMVDEAEQFSINEADD